MRRGGGKGGVSSAYELLAPTVAPGPLPRATLAPARASVDVRTAPALPPSPPRHDRPGPLHTNGHGYGRPAGAGTGLLPRPAPVPETFTATGLEPLPVLPMPPTAPVPPSAPVHPGPRPTRAPAPVPAVPPAAAPVRKRRWVTVAKVVVVAATLAVVGFQIAVVRPWLSATPTRPAIPHHRTITLPFTAAPATARPPLNPDPSAPGQQVNSGENRSDPFLLLADDRYYLYTSGAPFTNRLNVPVTSSTDFDHWSPVADVLPTLPAWATAGFTWSPDVHQFGSTYVLYYAALDTSLNDECIGAATSSSPIGPFNSYSATPFICQADLSGSIDPRVFTDSSGVNWMVWKSDENAHSQPTDTTMWSQQLTSDGLGLVGTPNDLMSPDEPWQKNIVEAPDMFEVNGVYWLAYSGNWFNQPPYAIGVAWCLKPEGPCVDVTDHPLLGSNTQGLGPGEESIYQDATGGVWMLYTPVMSSQFDPPRPVYITRIGLTNQGAYLAAGGPPAPTPSPLAGQANGSSP